MLQEIRLENVGPSESLHLPLAPRLNVLTGDNGLGKTVLLDVMWWALTATWAGLPVQPRVGGQTALVHVLSDALPNGEGQAGYNHFQQRWDLHSLPKAPYFRTLTLYSRADGTLSTWDYPRNSVQNPPERIPAFHFSASELWNGLRQGGETQSEGLERDCIMWQARGDERFEAMQKALAHLSPPEEPLRIGKPRRVFVQDGRDRPTLIVGGEEIPLIFASAGMKRILGLAYGLIWAWHEQKAVAELLLTEPVVHINLLVDEPESHLHPRWQRTIVPSLMAALETLGTQSFQISIATHSPLVLASLEPLFDKNQDRLFLLQPGPRGAEAVVADWNPEGTASSWLVSDVFGLRQARSKEAEEAIEAAEALMRGDEPGRPGLATQDEIHAALVKLLPDVDPFWPRWLVTQGMLERAP